MPEGNALQRLNMTFEVYFIYIRNKLYPKRQGSQKVTR